MRERLLVSSPCMMPSGWTVRLGNGGGMTAWQWQPRCAGYFNARYVGAGHAVSERQLTTNSTSLEASHRASAGASAGHMVWERQPSARNSEHPVSQRRAVQANLGHGLPLLARHVQISIHTLQGHRFAPRPRPLGWVPRHDGRGFLRGHASGPDTVDMHRVQGTC